MSPPTPRKLLVLDLDETLIHAADEPTYQHPQEDRYAVGGLRPGRA